MQAYDFLLFMLVSGAGQMDEYDQRKYTHGLLTGEGFGFFGDLGASTHPKKRQTQQTVPKSGSDENDNGVAVVPAAVTAGSDRARWELKQLNRKRIKQRAPLLKYLGGDVRSYLHEDGSIVADSSGNPWWRVWSFRARRIWSALEQPIRAYGSATTISTSNGETGGSKQNLYIGMRKCGWRFWSAGCTSARSIGGALSLQRIIHA